MEPAGPGLVPTPPGPVQVVVDGLPGRGDQGEDAPDLGHRQRDQAGLGGGGSSAAVGGDRLLVRGQPNAAVTAQTVDVAMARCGVMAVYRRTWLSASPSQAVPSESHPVSWSASWMICGRPSRRANGRSRDPDREAAQPAGHRGVAPGVRVTRRRRRSPSATKASAKLDNPEPPYRDLRGSPDTFSGRPGHTRTGDLSVASRGPDLLSCL